MLLRSKAEVAVLGVVLFYDGLHLREIARRAGISPPEAKRELDALVRAGILKMHRMGNMSIYALDQRCPFAGELKGLYLKTEGLIPLLKAEFSKLAGLKYAFVYGSLARGDYTQKSDADVLIVGDAKPEDVDDAVLSLQKNAGREVNYVLWTQEDLRKKMKEKTAFALSIARGEKAWLFGDENEFKRDAEKAGTRKG